MKTRLLDLIDKGNPLQGPLFDSLAARLERGGSRLQSGQRVGPYRIEQLLGQGGMASVYLAARDDGEFEQKVALKVVAAEARDATRREILKRERQILAHLQHPGIARLLDGGSTAEGLIWFAMEPVAGERIDRYCGIQRLAPEARVGLMLDVCDAVGFAHSQLLVHRDIKPSNILVTAQGRVKLLDFGIAGMLAMELDRSDAPRALSPGHASPEQMAGDAVGTASDIWQLGVLFAEMLRAGAGDDDANRPTHADLVAIIAKAAAPRPQSRYGTVAELAADLGRFLQRRPVVARGSGMIYRLGRFLSRRRYSVASGAAVMLAFAALVAHSTVRLAQQRDVALINAERANATTDFLLGLFSGAEPNHQRGALLSANDLLDIGERKLESSLHDQPALRASLLSTIARVHLSLGQYPRAELLLAEAVRVGRDRDDVDRVQLAYRLRELARAQWRQDQFDHALRSARESESLLPQGDAHLDIRMLLLNTQAAIAARLGRHDEAVTLELRAIAMAESGLASTRKPLAYAYNNLATAYRGLGRQADALRTYGEAMRVLGETVGKAHSDYQVVAVQHALQLALGGRHDEALTRAGSAIVELERLLGDDSGAMDDVHRTYAEIAILAKEPALALQAAERARRGTRARAGPDSLAFAASSLTYAEALTAFERPARAIEAYADAFRIRSARLPAEHDETRAARAALGRALCDAGRVAEASALLHAAGNATDSHTSGTLPQADGVAAPEPCGSNATTD